jgi:hypothetical protein
MLLGTALGFSRLFLDSSLNVNERSDSIKLQLIKIRNREVSIVF